MSGENYVNTASTATTATPVGPSDLTFVVAAYTGWPTAPFWGEFEKGTASAEIVRVTNVAGTTLTITRGQGGTAATSHGAGVTFEHVVPASHFNETEAHIAATAAHGVTGVVVGTTGAQTVQDKTFRGKHLSQHSDALPAGVTRSFESVADTATARDSFVVNNTGADATRSAFLLVQSGTDRFKVSNAGNVTVTPSSGTALTANGPASVTGAVTAGSTLAVTGAASLNGGVAVTGAASVSGTSTLAAVNATNVSASGTVHATGALDTDSTLVVDGASTLTGTVTAGGTVNAVTLAASGAVTGASAAITNQVTSYGGRVVAANTTFPSSPIDGQFHYKTDEVMLYRYNNTITAWSRYWPNVPRCELRQTTLQAIPNSTWTALIFQTEDLDTHNGHAASGTSYTVPAGWSGCLDLQGGAGFAAAAGTARALRWSKNGVVVPRGSALYANDSGSNMVIPAKNIKLSVVAGDVITLEAWANVPAGVNTEVTSENQAYMSVEWKLV